MVEVNDLLKLYGTDVFCPQNAGDSYHVEQGELFI